MLLRLVQSATFRLCTGASRTCPYRGLSPRPGKYTITLLPLVNYLKLSHIYNAKSRINIVDNIPNIQPYLHSIAIFLENSLQLNHLPLSSLIPPMDQFIFALTFSQGSVNSTPLSTHTPRALPTYFLIQDGSRHRNKSTYICSINEKIFFYRLRNPFSVSSAELAAIFLCAFMPFPPQNWRPFHNNPTCTTHPPRPCKNRSHFSLITSQLRYYLKWYG